MDTDNILYRLFRHHPDWLRDLTGLPLPEGCRASSQVLKQLEIRCDLFLEPQDPSDPHYIIEFQFYHDHSIFNRSELARAMVWKHLNERTDCRKRSFQPREVEVVIIFGSSEDLPDSAHRYPQTKILFMDELLDILKSRTPDSPLVAALAPLKEPIKDLERNAQKHYHSIKNAPDLEASDRDILSEIFLNVLLQRFKTKTRKEIRAMIAELPSLKDTQVAKEFLEEGMNKKEREFVINLKQDGFPIEKIAKLTNLSENEVKRILDQK